MLKIFQNRGFICQEPIIYGFLEICMVSGFELSIVFKHCSMKKQTEQRSNELVNSKNYIAAYNIVVFRLKIATFSPNPILNSNALNCNRCFFAFFAEEPETESNVGCHFLWLPYSYSMVISKIREP